MKLKVNSKEILNVLSCLVSLIFAILFEKLRAQTGGEQGVNLKNKLCIMYPWVGISSKGCLPF